MLAPLPSTTFAVQVPVTTVEVNFIFAEVVPEITALLATPEKRTAETDNASKAGVNFMIVLRILRNLFVAEFKGSGGFKSASGYPAILCRL